MTQYKFEIHASADITVEADTQSEARMMLVDDSAMYEEELLQDVCISCGDEV